MKQSQEMQSAVSNLSNEWYTPGPELTRIRRVIGDIDLDPASCEEANKLVKAHRFFDKDDDGLSMPWFAGSVFLNPPFGKIKNKSLAGIWLEKMLDEFNAGRFDHGIALTHTRPGYEWWESMWRKVPVCLTREKIDFLPGDGRVDTTGSKTSQTFFLFTKSPFIQRIFQYEFGSVGRVLLPEI